MSKLLTGEAIVNATSYYNQKVIPFYFNALDALIILVVGWIVIFIIKKIVKRIMKKTPFEETIEIFIYKSIGRILWIILVLIILSVLGINIGPILAGLGIVAFIIGFALKDTLGNVAAGLMLMAYRPFRIGDEVDIAGVKGKVKAIDIGVCVVVTDDNQIVTIPNSKIWGGPIKNLSEQKK